MQVIKVNKLTKKYGSFLALDKVSFNIEEGDFFGFIGPNGAGKTTTIKSILNLLKYTGDIELFGKNNCYNSFQKDIGYVPGEASLYDNLKVKEQIKYFCKYYTSVDKKYLDSLIKLFQIDLDKKISSLSLGNKKKVSIVLALMHQPKLLIFDEVSNGLDPLMQKVLFKELTRLNNIGVTILFSSHNLEEVQNYCKNVAIIKDGKIVEIDNISQILNKLGVDITIGFNKSFSIKWFKDNTSNLKILDGNQLRFIFNKDIKILLRYLVATDISFLRINDAKLEDIFSEYYSKGKNK